MARTFDDYITEPHIRRYYRYLLQYGEDDSEKGDFQINARGSSALVERSLQAQEMAQLLSASLNPLFGLDPKKAMAEHLKSRKLDPKAFEYDDEKWRQIVANMSKGPNDPRLAVAQLRADLEQRLQAAEQGFERQENERDRQVDLVIAQLDQVARGAELSAESRDVLAQIKQRLADTVIKVRAQQSMAAQDRQHDARQAVRPPFEPRGRAPKGRAYQK